MTAIKKIVPMNPRDDDGPEDAARRNGVRIDGLLAERPGRVRKP